MVSPDDQVESLSRKIEERERRSRRRTLALTLVPVIFAGFFLAYSSWQIFTIDRKLVEKTDLLSKTERTQVALNTSVPEAQTAVAAAETAQVTLQLKLSQSQMAIAIVTAQLSVMRDALDEARGFVQNICPFDEVVIKEYASDYSPQVEVLVFLFSEQQRRVPWNPDGFSDADGFDSPNFALFVLQNAIPGLPLVSTENGPGTRPWNVLSPISTPRDGDIVYYQSGYTMFYYEFPVTYGSLERKKCVIGMTPFGILSLKMDFAPQAGVLKVPYP